MSMQIGSCYKQSGPCEFTVWAPFRERVDVKILSPKEKIISLQKDDRGYWKTSVEGLISGSQYMYVLDGSLERPDPASFFQQDGVHGPSSIIDHNEFSWHDQNWQNISLAEMIIYELHVGTFTEEGTFAAVIPRLEDLLELGVNTIELMPVAQFPGGRNWGYDGVYPFAVQNSYGGPDGLKKLVDVCHSLGVSVILDVVYNHLGPEGNYFYDYGPYFTEKYRTPWGKAINFDDAYSDDVRKYFIRNALYWFEHFHIDGLRLDAVHAINDDSAKPFLKDLKARAQHWSNKHDKNVYLIAESDLNDVKILNPPEKGGFGLDAQWSDDFHHCIHALLTGENGGYYQDFGKLHQLKKTLEESFVYSWDYSAYRKRYHGSSAKDAPADQFVVSLQNHDQVGNRMLGDRLPRLVSFEGLKAAAGLLFFSPYIPMLFMGEEYAEEAPFNYFVSHSQKDLIEAVRNGRNSEFASFNWKGKPLDPQAETTYLNSKIKWDQRVEGKHKTILDYYKELIELRKSVSAIRSLQRTNIEITCLEEQNTLYFRRWSENDQVMVLINFGKIRQKMCVDLPKGRWKKIVDSLEEKWGGPGALLENKIDVNSDISIGPLNFAAYRMES